MASSATAVKPLPNGSMTTVGRKSLIESARPAASVTTTRSAPRARTASALSCQLVWTGLTKVDILDLQWLPVLDESGGTCHDIPLPPLFHSWPARSAHYHRSCENMPRPSGSFRTCLEQGSQKFGTLSASSTDN